MEKPVYRLNFIEGPVKGLSFLISQHACTIGRDEYNSICLMDATISKQHAKIINEEGTLHLMDLDSRNGTFLDGARLAANKPYPLYGNCMIRIGSFAVQFKEERPVRNLEEDTNAGIDRDGDYSRYSEAESTRVSGRDAIERKDGKATDPAFKSGKPFRQRERTIPFYIDSDRNLSAIYEMLNSVGTSAEKAFLIDKTMDLLMDVTGAQRGVLLLVDEANADKLVPVIVKTTGVEEAAPLSTISKTVISRVLKDGNSLLSTEVPGDPRFSKSKSLMGSDIYSIICAPINTKGKFYGLIYIDTTMQTKFFMKNDLELLTAVGIQLAIIMENIDLMSDFKELFMGVTKTLVYVIEAKDEYTSGHTEQVTQLSLQIAAKLGLDQHERELLEIAALLHDIGKVAIPEEILRKPGKLSDEEFVMIKQHPFAGSEFVRHLKGFEKIIEGIKYHHERFDGKGYPYGVAGKKIPLLARIISVADAFAAMTSERSYKRKIADDKAMEELYANMDTQFDGDIIRAFHDVLENEKSGPKRI
ncbi:MAG: HD domain-containing phosphohydrolase [Pseudomonadota bacterium]